MNTRTSRNTAYFISDAHLGIDLPGCKEREIHLCHFLASIKESADTLFIVGDLFDFWIEYKYSIRPDYVRVLTHLVNLVDAGVEVNYLAGNHDFAMGSFLNDSLGIRVYTDVLKTTVQGKRLYLYHGDGLIASDYGYRFFKRVVRSRFNQRLYGLLHPGIGVPLARFFSGTSRRLELNKLTEEKEQEYRNHAARILKEGYDIVFFAHTHKPELVEMGDKLYCNTGEWIYSYSYASMSNGTLTLWSCTPGQEPQKIPSQTFCA